MTEASSRSDGVGVVRPHGEVGVEPGEHVKQTTPGDRGEDGGTTSKPTLDKSASIPKGD